MPLVGCVVATGDPFQPYRLLDAAGVAIPAADAYFAELCACGRPATTQRSYGMDLLRWFRFLSAVGVDWDQGEPCRGAGFLSLVGGGAKAGPPALASPGRVLRMRAGPSAPNAVTGKRPAGPRMRRQRWRTARACCARFYDFHLEAGTGPMVNPFPLVAAPPRAGRGAPQPDGAVRRDSAAAGTGRRSSTRAPRMIPDERFDALFAELGSHRDRALVAFWVSDRRAGLGAARRDGRRRRPGPAADHRDP